MEITKVENLPELKLILQNLSAKKIDFKKFFEKISAPKTQKLVEKIEQKLRQNSAIDKKFATAENQISVAKNTIEHLKFISSIFPAGIIAISATIFFHQFSELSNLTKIFLFLIAIFSIFNIRNIHKNSPKMPNLQNLRNEISQQNSAEIFEIFSEILENREKISQLNFSNLIFSVGEKIRAALEN